MLSSKYFTYTLILLLSILSSVYLYSYNDNNTGYSISQLGADPIMSVIHRESTRSAPVNITTFISYHCPYSWQIAIALDSVRTQLKEKVNISYRHFPLSDSSSAPYAAAVAAECARKQNHFGAYRDALFKYQTRLGKLSLSELARKVHVPNISIFSDCLTKRRTVHTVKKDISIGKQLGMSGVPFSIIGSKLVVGVPDADEMISIVRSELIN